MSTIPFSEAVATRCGVAVDRVEAALQRNGIVPDPTPPRSRRLRVKRMKFAGTKNLHDVTQPFVFERKNMQDGLWIIASDDNLSGKSSTLQIILWALRGTPKTLANDVKDWLERVEVDFVADDRLVKVHFDVADGVPSGTVSIEGEPEAQQFGNDESFKRVMQDVMLRTLGLEAIPVTQKIGPENETVRYDDGWLAYTGAFLSDARSNAIIGEYIQGTNNTSRFLQLFLGIPWATTLFQARAAKRVLEGEVVQRKRKMSSLGGKTVEQMGQEITTITAQIEDEGTRNAAVAQITTAQRDLDTIQGRISAMRMRVSEFEALVQDCKEARIHAERQLLDIKEESRSSAFFKQLDPVECPRCSTKITAERRKLESSKHECSVCATVAANPDPAAAQAELADAQHALAEAEKNLKSAEDARSQSTRRLAELLADRQILGNRLSELSRLGTAVDVQMLEKRRERVEGMLEVARSVVGDGNEADDALQIVAAAETEADDRTKQAADAVLARASAEITRIFRALGVTAADEVRLDRSARARVTKGGVITGFGDLSDGEQLRLRIATVLALMHTAKEHRTGRHPGFLIIDSPGNADMKGENVAEAIREISAVVKDVTNVQIIVGMRGVELARSVAPSADRVISAGDGERLW